MSGQREWWKQFDCAWTHWGSEWQEERRYQVTYSMELVERVVSSTKFCCENLPFEISYQHFFCLLTSGIDKVLALAKNIQYHATPTFSYCKQWKSQEQGKFKVRDYQWLYYYSAQYYRQPLAISVHLIKMTMWISTWSATFPSGFVREVIL